MVKIKNFGIDIILSRTIILHCRSLMLYPALYASSLVAHCYDELQKGRILSFLEKYFGELESWHPCTNVTAQSANM